MSLSSISGAAQGATIGGRSTFVPTKALNTVRSAPQGVAGRGGDSFHCATCGGDRVSPSIRSTVGAAASSARTSTPAAASNTYGNFCPTCAAKASHSVSDRAGVVFFHSPKTAGVR